MKKLTAAVLFCAVFLCSCGIHPIDWNQGKANSSVAVSSQKEKADVSSAGKEKKAAEYFYNDIKAVWISYLELEPILKGKTKEEFSSSFEKMVKNVSAAGLNTVIVHARPFSDSLYPSKLFPVSEIAGESLTYDPLEIMIQLSHKYDLSFHAWINPLRGALENKADEISDKFEIKKLYDSKSGTAGIVKGRWYLNPAYPQVRSLIAKGAAEIVQSYSVDAIHMDDYFYPTKSKSFDKASYKKYGKGKSLSDFRLENINLLVKEIYDSIHKVNPKIKLGISPQGNIENNYKSQFADVKKWCGEKGYADYIMPQIYYGFQNETSPFKEVVEHWGELVKGNEIILAAGLACHKINMAVDAYAGSGKKEWAKNSGIIASQIAYLKENKAFAGFSLYSYKFIFDNKENEKELEKIKEAL